MIIRNGINSTLRARKRSILFAALIFTLTISLSLGVSLRAYCDSLLLQMEDSYTSVAIVEYLGSDYPDRNAADPYSREAAESLKDLKISDIPGVKLWETTDRTFAVVEGYERKIGEVPYPNTAVLECMSFVPYYENGVVPYTKDQLKSSYIAEADEYGDNRAFIQFSPGNETGWLPFYHYIPQGDPITGTFAYSQVDEVGVPQFTQKEDLPNEYIAYGRFAADGLGYNTYQYVRNSQIVWTYTPGKAINANKLTRYAYSPEEDLYYGNGKVVSTYSALTASIPYAYGKGDRLAIEVDLREIGLVPEPGKHYLFHGAFMESGRNNYFVLTDFYDGCKTPPYLQTGDPEAEKIFYDYAKFYSHANNAVNVEAAADIEALEIFQQGNLTLMQGRFPKTGEKDVCIVTWDMAQNMELTLGDTVTLSTLRSNPDDRYDLTLEDRNETLTVIGITNTSEEYYGSLWVTSANGNFTSPLFGYELGRAVLDNKTANETAKAIQNLCPSNVRVTMYDQGYTTAIQPMQSMKTTALAVTIAAAVSTVAVLLLFAFLFVGRQKETVQVLVSLGTPQNKIRLWLLSGATVVSGATAFAGAAISTLTMGQMIRLALLLATKVYAVDGRYSETTIGYSRETLPQIPVPVWPALIAASVIFILGLLFCCLFISQAKRQSAPRKGKLSVRVPRSGTSTFGRMPFRFAILSARRGGWRSVVVPVAALVLSLLLGVLTSGAQGWNSQLRAVYEDAHITGQAVSNNGRQSNHLVISTQNARLLWQSRQLDYLGVSIGWNYWLDEEMPSFGNTAFAAERRQNWIERQPEIVALNEMRAASEFIQGSLPQVTWLEGWQEDFLSEMECNSFLTSEYFYGYKLALKPEKERSLYPCLVSQDFLEDHGLTLGEIFYVSMQYHMASDKRETVIQLTPVGTFPKTSNKANIYVPLSFWCSPSLLTSEESPIDASKRATSTFASYEDRDHYFYSTTSFQTCTFALKDSQKITDFRNYLAEQNISRVRSPGKNRLTVILHDQSFIEAAEGLNRYISFSKILFPVLFAVVGLLGFVISWLMINGRRMEFAILRGLGASGKNVFLSFFLEQVFLCLTGCALSCAALGLLAEPGVYIWLSVLLFAVCYLVGCAMAVKSVSRTNLVMLLSERE